MKDKTTIIISPKGYGKTLYMTAKAKKYSNKYPNNNIYGNYNLKLPRFIYTPYMFIPFSELKTSLFIIDDIQFLKSMENFFSLQSNSARKLFLQIYMSGQEKKQVIAKIRRTADKFIRVLLIKQKDLLLVQHYQNETLFDYNIPYKITYIENIIKTYGNLYNTNQIVDINDDIEIIQEIKKWSKTDKDLRFNLKSVYNNEAKRKRIYKNITGKNLY